MATPTRARLSFCLAAVLAAACERHVVVIAQVTPGPSASTIAATAPIGALATRSGRLAAGGLAVCRVKADGAVACLGSLGFRDPVQKMESRVIAGLPPAAEVSVGLVHACARTVSGEVWCWGGNEKGELGRGTASQVFESPAAVIGLPKIVTLKTNGQQNCALAEDASVFCWGGGSGDMAALDDKRARPSRAAGIAGAVSIEVGHQVACAVLATGTARCWDRDGKNRDAAEHGADPSLLSNVKEIATGGPGAVALERDGTVSTSAMACMVDMGSDPSDGMPTVGRASPGWTKAGRGGWVKVPGIRNARHVTTDNHTGCALGEDGQVRCWGCLAGSWAPGTANPALPVLVPNLEDVVEVHSALTVTCALRKDDSVVCWGIGIIAQSDTPTRIALE